MKKVLVNNSFKIIKLYTCECSLESICKIFFFLFFVCFLFWLKESSPCLIGRSHKQNNKKEKQTEQSNKKTSFRSQPLTGIRVLKYIYFIWILNLDQFWNYHVITLSKRNRINDNRIKSNNPLISRIYLAKKIFNCFLG